MTRLFNIPADFADEMIDGFVAANRNQVRRVSGGVVRSTRSPEGSVALVIGGGSGHYPAFGGLVGQGLANGAAMGNLFASPSARQVESVATAASRGGGVLLSYGNYAGDVLHFSQAQEKLNAAGIPTRTVVVTDDISSAPSAEKHKRRGIAGDLTVFKAAAAAAAAGYPLDEVVRVAEHANERTRSFGVAFSGCTLPGAAQPLFTVPAGRMAVGMGIHGEPGIGETDVPTADELASTFVEALLGELPDGVDRAGGQRVGVILNGLGSVKYEELFVVYRTVAALLEAEGITIVDPEVGELVTSFDMAGVSLTLFWLDEELERFWQAPADTPAYRKGSVPAVGRLDESDFAAEIAASIAPASPESHAGARIMLHAIQTIAETIDANVDELGRLDAVAGDGDHGIGMQRGARAAAAAAGQALAGGAGALTLLDRAADAWSDRAGGTSGALWSVVLKSIGLALGDTSAPTPALVVSGVRAATDGILSFGAVLGDKTMVDALVPFSDTLAREVGRGIPLPAAWATAAAAATLAAASTATLLPRMGRARPHAEKSLGTPDAGAHSFGLIVQAIATELATHQGDNR